jgi:hypothetical protein
MSSTDESVVFRGILRGLGNEVPCSVSATKVSLPGSSVVEHTNYSIKDVRAALPDGIYQLLTNGLVIPMRCYNGGWFSTALN